MKRIIAIVGAVALALSACGSDNEPRMVQTCADSAGNYLPDYMCDSPQGIYPAAFPYYIPWATWHDTVEVHHHHYVTGQHLTGGTVTAPRSARVQSASHPGKVTVYDSGKKTVKTTNKSFGTVTKSQKKASSTTPKYGSYQKITSRKSGKCC